MRLQEKINPDTGSFAFFDVDDTLISVKSMLSFQDHWYRFMGEHDAEARYRADLQEHMHDQACWSFLNRLYYRHFAGRKEADVIHMASDWFALMRKNNPDFYHSPVVEALLAHQRQGQEVVFVSGSFPALLNPIARELGVSQVLATRMEVIEGRYTGEILPPQTIGEGKAEAITAFLAEHSASAETCYAYGDDWSDLPMLQAVGHPVVVAGGRRLETFAKETGWPVLQPI